MRDNLNDCPGRHKCHGPASWCNECGDVDLVCDDPRCEVHARGEERRALVNRLRAEFAETYAANEAKLKELIEALYQLKQWTHGIPVMAGRESRERQPHPSR